MAHTNLFDNRDCLEIAMGESFPNYPVTFNYKTGQYSFPEGIIETRDRVLAVLHQRGETCSMELMQITGADLFEIKTVTQNLRQEGIVATIHCREAFTASCHRIYRPDPLPVRLGMKAFEVLEPLARRTYASLTKNY